MKHLNKLICMVALLGGFLNFAAGAADFSTSPMEGTIDMEVNPAGISAFDLICSEKMVINREAKGFIELKKGPTLLMQIPAQNQSKFYLFEGFEKYVESSTTANINFFVGGNLPTTEKGDYTVTIPAGFVLIGNNKVPNEPLTFNWSVPDILGGAVVTPAAGKMKSLSTITFTYPEGSVISVDNTPTTEKYTDEDGTTHEYLSYPISLNSISYDPIVPKIDIVGNKVIFTFDPVVTAPADYSFDVAANAITVTQGNTSTKNKFMNVRYYIENADSFKTSIFPMVGSYEYFDALETGWSDFPHALFMIKLPQTGTSEKWVKLMERPVLAPVHADGSYSTDKKEDPNVILLNSYMWNQEDGTQYLIITNPSDDTKPLCPVAGKYALVVPSKALYCHNTVTNSVVHSPQLDYIYNITGVKIPCEITPAPGSTVESIKDITLRFEPGMDVKLGNIRQAVASLSNGIADYELLGEVNPDMPNEVTFTVNYTDLDVTGNWVFKTPGEMFQVGEYFPVITAEYRVEKTVSDFNWIQSPSQQVNLENNPEALASISLEFNKEVSINREAPGYITLFRGEEVLRQVPAQNIKDFYVFEGMTKTNKGLNILVSFYSSKNNPTQEPGDYRVEIPATFLMIDNNGVNETSPTIKVEWTVPDPSAVLDGYRITPVEGTKLPEISEITMTFPEGAKISYDDSSREFTMEDPETGEVLSQTIDNISMHRNGGGDDEYYRPEIKVNANVLTFSFNPAVTIPGTYYLNVLPNSISYELNGEIHDIKDEIYYRLVIEAEMELFPITPAPEEGPFEFFPAFETGDASCPNALFEITLPTWVNNVPSTTVRLYPTDANGNFNVDDKTDAIALYMRQTTEINPQTGKRDRLFIYNTSYTASLYPAPGTYALVIPSNAASGILDNKVTYSSELVYYYTVEGGNNISYSINPADEATVESIKDVVITFPNAKSINFRESNDCLATLTNGYATYVLSPRVDPASPTQVTFSVNNCVVTEPGDWTFRTPSKYFTVDNTTPYVTAIYHIGAAVVEAPTYAITPADGAEMESLQEVVIQCSTTDVYVGSKFNAIITDGNTEVALSPTAIASGKITLSADEEIITAGAWTLTIAEGSFIASDFESPEMTATYLLEGKVIIIDPVYTLSPSDKATMQTLGNVVVTCDQTPVTVTDSFEAYAYNATSTISFNVVSNHDGVITLAPTYEITRADDYTFVIKAGSFEANGIASPELRALYVVEGLPYSFAYTISPADNSTVNELEEIVITANSEEISRNNLSASLTDGTDVINVTLVEIFGSEIVLAPAKKVSDGIWTLTVAEGSFLVEDGIPTPEIKATFIVKGESGVSLLSADGVFTVYDIDGKLLLQDADAEVLNTLTSGIYIINGHKVIIK